MPWHRSGGFLPHRIHVSRVAREVSFEVVTSEERSFEGETLIVGTADVGVAGLTAADYLTTHVEAEQVGHVRARNLPKITPFTGGVPRHPIRLYALQDADVVVCVSELLVPVWVADPLGAALFDWASAAGLGEVAVLYGAMFPHAEEEHAVFGVGTEPFRERHFGGDDGIEPLAQGYFDGVVAELVSHGLAPDAPPVGALVTPGHPPGPDLEGAVRLIEAFETVFDVPVDEEALRSRSAEMKAYYQGLAERMQSLREGEGSLRGGDLPEDRMYM